MGTKEALVGTQRKGQEGGGFLEYVGTQRKGQEVGTKEALVGTQRKGQEAGFDLISY